MEATPGGAPRRDRRLDLHGELRRLYRDAFQRLTAQARIEEGAFLLAEVLHAREEAVAFLERHGRLRLAAEVAEASDLPPGLRAKVALADDHGRVVVLDLENGQVRRDFRM